MPRAFATAWRSGNRPPTCRTRRSHRRPRPPPRTRTVPTLIRRRAYPVATTQTSPRTHISHADTTRPSRQTRAARERARPLPGSCRSRFATADCRACALRARSPPPDQPRGSPHGGRATGRVGSHPQYAYTDTGRVNSGIRVPRTHGHRGQRRRSQWWRQKVDREQILRIAANHPGWSNRQIAEVYGCSHSTVDKFFREIPRPSMQPRPGKPNAY
ncbi:helix-turn-helix domain-containing protein [Nocardia sp. alder85J]|uniref:helix-turn-helix domain-containing protein n=1 Tax=Nocardia sp. alder85J TaxID=2862949 RepID=UPI001CD220C1